MRMFLGSLAFTILAFAVLRTGWAFIRSRQGLVVFWGLATVVHVGWLLADHVVVTQGTAGVSGALIRAMAGVWLAACLVCFLVGTPLVVGVWLFRKARGPWAKESSDRLEDVGRRQWLGSVLPAAAFSTGAVGAFGAMKRFNVVHHEVPIPGLPRALDGFSIGHITDSHVGSFVEPGDLAHAVETLDLAGVQLQVLTGDLLDDLALLDRCMRVLEGCRAPHGMVAVLGNHEKKRGQQQVEAAYRQAAERGPVRLLVDESMLVHHKDALLRVVGVDYPMRPGGRHALPKPERLALMATSAQRAFSQAQHGETVLCLSHHPDFFPLAAQHGAQLTLAGHTHGGHVTFLGRPMVESTCDYVVGHHQRGGSHLYVSAGTGHWFPFRMGVPTEVTIHTLRTA